MPDLIPTGDRTRGEALQKLGVRFRSGFDEKRLAGLLEDLNGWQIETVDLIEGVERVIATRETTTFPPSAEVRRRCMEARNDRLRAQRANDRSENSDFERLPTPGEIEEAHQVRALARVGVFFCDTCCAFKQAAAGQNSGWNPCHYEENRALWAAGRDRKSPAFATQAAFDEHQPPMTRGAQTKRIQRKGFMPMDAETLAHIEEQRALREGTKDLTPLGAELEELPF